MIINEVGELVEAEAPIIISASRATDIPAFYSNWLINRLRKGWVLWRNPFNQKTKYISFSNCRAIVFWTKNPIPLISRLREIDEMGIRYYFQFTLNNYEKENLEPNVPPLENRIEAFKKLSDIIGREKVIWRFDPIIIRKELSTEEILRRIKYIGERIKGYTEKLVFSFVEILKYKKVKINLLKETKLFDKIDINEAEATLSQKMEIAEGLAKIRDKWKTEGWNLKLATCAEKIDFDIFDIEHNRCIDIELMKKIFYDDKNMTYYFNYGRMPESEDRTIAEHLSLLVADDWKDKGQRKFCGCMKSKDIGMYNTCVHLCSYCYANSSKELVIKNFKLSNIKSESLAPIINRKT